MPAIIGKPAPAFKAAAVVDGEIKEVSLSDYHGKYVVVFFYPLDWTFVCPTEITAFSDRLGEFKAIDAEVLGVSVDSVFSHLAWISTPRNRGGLGGCTYPLISDLTKGIAKDYEVLVTEGPDAGVSLRGLFIIAPDGKLRQKTVNDLPVGRSIDETLRLVKAFQFTDVHGEVCPANWQPGEKTMQADPEGSKQYFSQIRPGMPLASNYSAKPYTGRWLRNELLHTLALLWILLCYAFTWVEMCSRIIDNSHSPADIAAGVIVGFGLACVYFQAGKDVYTYGGHFQAG